MNAEKISKGYNEETRLALLEQSISNINDSLIRFEKRFDRIDIKFDLVHSEAKTHHRWAMGAMLGLYAMVTTVLVTVIIKVVH